MGGGGSGGSAGAGGSGGAGGAIFAGCPDLDGNSVLDCRETLVANPGRETRPVFVQGRISSDAAVHEVNHVGFVLRRSRDRFLRPDVGLYQGGGTPLRRWYESHLCGVGGPARSNQGVKREPDRAKRQTTVGPTLIKEDGMEYLIAGITAVFLFIYLMYALLRPERF